MTKSILIVTAVLSFSVAGCPGNDDDINSGSTPVLTGGIESNNAIDSDNPSPICTTSAIAGLNVTILYPSDDNECYTIQVIARDGDYTEKLKQIDEGVCIFTGAFERAGTYSITVKGEYIETLETGPFNVPMTDDGCHISTQFITINVDVICRSLPAYPFDELNDCFRERQIITGVCARSWNPEGDMGTGTHECIVSPDGTAYLVFITFTEEFVSNDWNIFDNTNDIEFDKDHIALCQEAYGVFNKLYEQKLPDGISEERAFYNNIESCSEDTNVDERVTCCPISRHPSCCMLYGGSNVSLNACETVCDGIPAPDEDWQQKIDENGCAFWEEPTDYMHVCGEI